MPKNNVSDPITDQEIAFARLVLSGTMTDRLAAEAVGLHPGSAAYIKSRPRVRAYMLQHRAAVQQRLVEQDTEGLRRFDLGRDQVLARLWEIANLDPEKTRGSASAQVKALSMIIAMEGLIPDRRAVSAQNQSVTPPPVTPPFYVAAWRTQQQSQAVDPQPPPDPSQEEPAPERQSAPSGADDPPHLTPDPSLDIRESTSSPFQTTSSPHPAMSAFVPDSRVPFSIKHNRFGPRR